MSDISQTSETTCLITIIGGLISVETVGSKKLYHVVPICLWQTREDLCPPLFSSGHKKSVIYYASLLFLYRLTLILILEIANHFSLRLGLSYFSVASLQVHGNHFFIKSFIFFICPTLWNIMKCNLDCPAHISTSLSLNTPFHRPSILLRSWILGCLRYSPNI